MIFPLPTHPPSVHFYSPTPSAFPPLFPPSSVSNVFISHQGSFPRGAVCATVLLRICSFPSLIPVYWTENCFAVGGCRNCLCPLRPGTECVCARSQGLPRDKTLIHLSELETVSFRLRKWQLGFVVLTSTLRYVCIYVFSRRRRRKRGSRRRRRRRRGKRLSRRMRGRMRR